MINDKTDNHSCVSTTTEKTTFCFHKFVKTWKVVRKKVTARKQRERRREVITETVGYSPTDRRIQDLLKTDKSKRALKFAKSRLGTHKRAKHRRNKMSDALMKKGS